MPEIIRKLNEALGSTFVVENVAASNQLVASLASYCELRAMIAANPSRILSVQATSQAVALADELESGARRLPSNPPDYLEYHYYQDLCAAVIHNNYRMLLVLIHFVILSQLAVRKSRTAQDSAQIRKSHLLTQKTISDICGSVPYYLSLRCPLSSQPCFAAVNAIIWPLFVAGAARLCPQMTRAWIVDQLRALGRGTGVRQALVLAEIVSRKQEIMGLMVSKDDGPGITEPGVPAWDGKIPWCLPGQDTIDVP